MRLLIVDDQKRLAAEIASQAKAFHWQVDVAHCRDEATNSIVTKGPPDLLLVDVMLPATADAARRLDDLLDERDAIVRRYLPEGCGQPSDDDVEQTSDDLRRVDRFMEKLIDPDGGLQFLQKVASVLESSASRVYVFSAMSGSRRDYGSGVLQLDEWLKKLLPTAYQGWLKKPVSAKDLSNIMGTLYCRDG